MPGADHTTGEPAARTPVEHGGDVCAFRHTGERSAERRYSARSATVGCTRNARRVGTMHASMQTPNIIAA